MIVLAILVLCLAATIAWGIWHDSKALRAEDDRLDEAGKKSDTEIGLLRSRIETLEKAIPYLSGRIAQLEAKPAGAPMQSFDPQAAKRVQEQARQQGKHRR